MKYVHNKGIFAVLTGADTYDSCLAQQIIQRALGKHSTLQVRRQFAALIGFIVIPPLARSIVGIKETELFRIVSDSSFIKNPLILFNP